jgi:hypothetical protein
MWNTPSKERLAKIPKLYETENMPLMEKAIWLHFFVLGCDWFVAEFDGKDTFFGFAILNNDHAMAEWGNFSFSELKSLKIQGWLEVDCEKEEFWDFWPAADVAKIRQAMGWVEKCRSRACMSKG